jgi:hypothetical protein
MNPCSDQECRPFDGMLMERGASMVRDTVSAAGQRRHGQSVVERTAGALKRYAKQPPATIAEEKDAFAQGVADDVAGSLRQQRFVSTVADSPEASSSVSINSQPHA